MADRDRRSNSGKESLATGDKEEEELVQTLLELNHTVCNISRLIHQLQQSFVKDTVQDVDAISERTLH